MTEPFPMFEGTLRHRIAGWLVVGVLASYGTLILLPEIRPEAIWSVPFILYRFSLWPFASVLGAVFLLSGGLMLSARFRKRTASPSSRTIAFTSGTAVAWLALLLLVARIYPRGLPPGSHLAEFDAPSWRSVTLEERLGPAVTARQRMLGDLVERILPGRTKLEIEQALGPSSPSSNFEPTGRDLIYPLGPQRNSMFPVDSEWLLIWLDDSGRFKRCEILTD